ncbi:MAG: long-chain fatty acid--CoA ligase [Alphaproteobacteria bacterium]|nr:long-chain fatty acid--CoA ligase [Alphaproteobacteria bacterium]
MVLVPNPERRQAGIDFILRRSAELHPNRIAIDDRLSGTTLTYRGLEARASRLARALIARGVAKGEPVAYAFLNEHASLEALFACCMAGAVAVPLNNRLAPAEARDYLNRQEVAVFIANEALAGLADGAALRTRIIRGGKAAPGDLDYETLLDAERPDPLPPRAAWEDAYMMAMTGGTTGGPKAAVWSHGGCLLDTLGVIVNMEVARGDTTLCLAPTYHAAGLGWGVLPVLWQGGRVVMPPTATFNPRFVLEAVRTERVGYLLIVPAMIEPLRAAWDGRPIPELRAMCIASAPTPEPQRRIIQSIFPAARIIAGYGMTETFSMSMQGTGEFLSMPASVGEPALVSRIRIVDEAGRPVPRNTVGHILGRTMAMSLYYNNDAANTAHTFRVDPADPEGLAWMWTGDVGFMDDDGRVTIVDRAKDIIITGGENVASVEVETVLLDHPGVKECAVVGRHDDRWGERVVAVLVKQPNAADDLALAREVLALCRGRLAGYKVPKEIAFLDVLPRSPFGKVLKREIVRMELPRRVDGAALRGS